MLATNNAAHTRPWYLWLLAPFAFAGASLFLIVFGVLALLSIPYYLVNPRHHLHQWDLGTPHQQQRVARWR